MTLDNLFWWAPKWIDTQVGGALLQVGAALVVAYFVNRKGNQDRKAALTFEYDREWNTREMIEGRTAVEKRLRSNKDYPLPQDNDFTAIWQVIMFFGRVAAAHRIGQLDAKIYQDLIQRDAGMFAGRMADKWEIWGATREDYETLYPGRLPPTLKVR